MVRHYVARSSRLALSFFVAAASLHAAHSRVLAQQPSGTDRRASVLMLDFTVAALKDAADWAPIGKGIPHMLMTELAANPDIRIIDRERLQTALDEQKLTQAALVDPSTAARVGKIVGARYIVSGSVTVDPAKRLRLDVHGIKVETMVQEYSQKLTGKSDDVLELVAQLGQEMSKKFDPTPFDAPPSATRATARSRRRKVCDWRCSSAVPWTCRIVTTSTARRHSSGRHSRSLRRIRAPRQCCSRSTRRSSRSDPGGAPRVIRAPRFLARRSTAHPLAPRSTRDLARARWRRVPRTHRSASPATLAVNTRSLGARIRGSG